ncbi:MAG: hypothetical protein ABID84_02965 [Chloroflexota bacterium]
MPYKAIGRSTEARRPGHPASTVLGDGVAGVLRGVGSPTVAWGSVAVGVGLCGVWEMALGVGLAQRAEGLRS